MEAGHARKDGPRSEPGSINTIPTAEYGAHRKELLAAYRACRHRSMELTRVLSPEDHMLQSMPDASPAKWHLAHTTWFFEAFILADHEQGFSPHNPSYMHLFNSYYNGVGRPFHRPSRGMLSRPSLDEVHHYRSAVDQRLESLLQGFDEREFQGIADLLVLGINHEQQHQELILTDIKHALFQNPQFPACFPGHAEEPGHNEAEWLVVDAGKHSAGFSGQGFCFDNELPAHDCLEGSFRICSVQATNADWLEFIEDGGYEQPLLWLSDGWAWKHDQSVNHPLYWVANGRQWQQYTLLGLRPLQESAPVCHISYYEADAFARWSGRRLPTESEWEIAAGLHPQLQPFPGITRPGPDEFRQTWQWTSSAYHAYPGYSPLPGAVGEYNGKFMVNQMVLRGASGATPAGHSRISYRNFFHPSARWQYSGLRLVDDD